MLLSTTKSQEDGVLWVNEQKNGNIFSNNIAAATSAGSQQQEKTSKKN